MKDILRNIPKAEVLQLGNLVAYADGQVVSKTLVQNDGVGITLFAFAKDEGISTRSMAKDASRSTARTTNFLPGIPSSCRRITRTPFMASSRSR